MFNLPETVVFNKPRYKILTPNGYETFIGVNKIVKDIYVHLKFSNGEEIKCSENHPFSTIDGIIWAKELNKKTLIFTKDPEGCFLVSKRTIKKSIELYDIVESGKDNLYYTNNIVSHNCNFLGSTNTLIEAEKLATMTYKEPINEYTGMVIYEEPVKESFDEAGENQLTADRLYAICVDVSEGKNLDYSAFSVFDVSAIPYKQVAIYRSNTIAPMLFPTIIKLCAEYYNNAHVLVEINNNPQVATMLIEELGYEYVFRVSSGNKQAQTLSNRSGKGIMHGLKMSPLVKRIGCSTLKTLIEHEKLLLSDFETISELTTYTQQSGSWKAEEGCNDDLATSLVVFAWLTTQPMFKNLISTDIRKHLQLEQFNYSDPELLPIFEPQRGFDIPYFIEGDNVWVESKDQDCYKELFDLYFRG